MARDLRLLAGAVFLSAAGGPPAPPLPGRPGPPLPPPQALRPASGATARALRLLAGAVFLSAAGDLLALIVLGLQVHELTGSGLAVSALVASTLAPMVVLAPPAGLAADRF